jgi:hypothetical protein
MIGERLQQQPCVIGTSLDINRMKKNKWLKLESVLLDSQRGIDRGQEQLLRRSGGKLQQRVSQASVFSFAGD